ncbi:MAG TPA: nucleotide exchange factor GrpE [Acidimicrobiales bacterium]|nr:nucleotide exchange factor GrpE [Acidimicrobiales bacterium]
MTTGEPRLPGEGDGATRGAQAPGAAPAGAQGPGPAAGAYGHQQDAQAGAEDQDGPSGPAGPGPASGDPLARLAAERDEYLDHLRRVQADFENYKKRVIRQQTEHLERAAEGLVVKLLPVLDTLDLAQTHTDPDDEAGRALTAVSGSLMEVLGREGLERIDPLGQAFDPNEAEAVMHEPSDGGHEPEVVEVMRAGYRWRGRVVRPAMVKVKG